MNIIAIYVISNCDYTAFVSYASIMTYGLDSPVFPLPCEVNNNFLRIKKNRVPD